MELATIRLWHATIPFARGASSPLSCAVRSPFSHGVPSPFSHLPALFRSLLTLFSNSRHLSLRGTFSHIRRAKLCQLRMELLHTQKPVSVLKFEKRNVNFRRGWEICTRKMQSALTYGVLTWLRDMQQPSVLLPLISLALTLSALSPYTFKFVQCAEGFHTNDAVARLEHLISNHFEEYTTYSFIFFSLLVINFFSSRILLLSRISKHLFIMHALHLNSQYLNRGPPEYRSNNVSAWKRKGNMKI